VLRTRVGYAGGTTPAPTYRHLGDHSEALQVDFDAERTTYARLLELFFQSHNAAREPHSRQYRSAIFVHDERQQALALAEVARRGALTAVEPLGEFFLAEPYHQKYKLRRHGDLLEALSLADADLVASTLAARVNGFLSAPSAEQLAALEAQGLPERALRRLRMIAEGRV
jgi:peptide methionine sulfoxide reductase MsrA